jgi:CII-binding regulator of phage lambda lysogenization HflD
MTSSHSYNELHQRCLELEKDVAEKVVIIDTLKRRIDRMEEARAHFEKRVERLVQKLSRGLE